MAGFTDWMETEILNWSLRPGAQVNFTQPAAVFVGLYTVAPTDSAPGTEVATGSYVRQQVTFGTPASSAVTNSGTVTFPTATLDWGTILACGIFNGSASGANLLYSGNLSVSRQVKTGDVFKFEAANLTVSLD